jgi:hypothetical protein
LDWVLLAHSDAATLIGASESTEGGIVDMIKLGMSEEVFEDRTEDLGTKFSLLYTSDTP